MLLLSYSRHKRRLCGHPSLPKHKKLTTKTAIILETLYIYYSHVVTISRRGFQQGKKGLGEDEGPK